MITYWQEPGARYLDEAMEELGVPETDLDELAEDHVHSVPMGVYPTWDKVYDRAWGLRDAEESN